MTPCKFTDSAKRDITDIIEYTLNRWGKQRTLKYLDEIQTKIVALSKNPNIGTMRNDIHPTLLSFPMKKHMIYYLKQKSGIAVIRILHTNMYYKLHTFSDIGKL